MTRVAAGLAGVVVLLFAAPAAHAASQGRWMPERELTDQAAIEPRVAITATGEGIAAWGVRGPDVTIPGDAVSASLRPPGGQFGAPRVISPNDAIFVDMAANPAGDAAIGWFTNDGLGARFRNALGDWSEPAEFDARFSKLLVDGAGNTTIVYLEDERRDTETQTSKHIAYNLKAKTRFADGSVGPWRLIARAHTILGPDSAVDGAGNITAAWRESNGETSDMDMYAATAPPGGEFGPPRALEERRYHDNSSPMRVVANRRGDTLVAWGRALQQYRGAPMSAEGASSYRPAGGEFGPPETIHPPDDQHRGLYRWDLAMDDEGNTTFAWSNAHAGGRAFRPAAGPWHPSAPLGGFSLEPTVAVDGKGTATIAYVERTTDEFGRPMSPLHLMAVRKPRGGSFGKPAELSRAKHIYAPDSASDALGNTIVVWAHQERWAWSPDRTEAGIGAVIWDAAAPSIREFELDPEGESSATPAPEFDFALSEAATVAVSIERVGRKPVRIAKLTARSGRGEGAVAIGAKVEKKLRSGGSYRATIVARDSARRRSSPRRLTFRSLGR